MSAPSPINPVARDSPAAVRVPADAVQRAIRARGGGGTRCRLRRSTNCPESRRAGIWDNLAALLGDKQSSPSHKQLGAAARL